MMTMFIVRMAFRAMMHHKGRSMLTMLGIMIGIAGIIATTAIGRGAQKKARDQILSSGSRDMVIFPGNWSAKKKVKYKPMTYELLKTIESQCDKVRYISPGIQSTTDVEYIDKKFSIRLSCVNEHAFAMWEKKLKSRMFFTRDHVDGKENVIVIDHNAEEALFRWENPVGKIIRVRGIPFTVIGVMEKAKIESRWEPGKLRGNIPFTVGKKYFLHPGEQMHYISMSTYNEEDNPVVVRQVSRIVRSVHHLKEDDPNDFMLIDSQGMAAVAEGGSKIIALFALIAASIALLVGGIGIMNIMLVAVRERTKEIGIKLALGAQEKLIRRQFLLESVVLCAVGGLFGVLGGVAISFGLGKFTDLPAIIEALPIIISFLLTILIGLFFGYYPARKASKLDPVEALTEL